MSLLVADGLTVRYGGVTANDRVDLALEPGVLAGLIGPNGAGKTTCIDALTGFATADAGTVVLEGRDVTALRPDQRARLGLARTFQSLELFEDLDVGDNLRAAAERSTWRDLFLDTVRPARPRGVDRAVDAALEQVGLSEHARARPTDLSHGQRTLVGVARALAMQPRVLLLDEPAAGLDTHESLALGDRLRELAERGIAVLLVDHDMGLVFRVCRHLTVLDFGRVIAAGTPDDVRRDPAVVDAYLGGGTPGEDAPTRLPGVEDV